MAQVPSVIEEPMGMTLITLAGASVIAYWTPLAEGCGVALQFRDVRADGTFGMPPARLAPVEVARVTFVVRDRLEQRRVVHDVKRAHGQGAL